MTKFWFPTNFVTFRWKWSKIFSHMGTQTKHRDETNSIIDKKNKKVDGFGTKCHSINHLKYPFMTCNWTRKIIWGSWGSPKCEFFRKLQPKFSIFRLIACHEWIFQVIYWMTFGAKPVHFFIFLVYYWIFLVETPGSSTHITISWIKLTNGSYFLVQKSDKIGWKPKILWLTS